MSFSFVVFTSTNTHWTAKYLSRWINHCFIIKPDRGRWLVIEQTMEELQVYTIDDYSDILSNSIVVYCEHTGKKPNIILNTCVGIVKSIVGINSLRVQTPLQLYRYLQNAKSKKTAKDGRRDSVREATNDCAE